MLKVVKKIKKNVKRYFYYQNNNNLDFFGQKKKLSCFSLCFHMELRLFNCTGWIQEADFLFVIVEKNLLRKMLH